MTQKELQQQVDHPVVSAHRVGLRYVMDEMPGIRREKSGTGFRFRYSTGDLVEDEEVLRRIKSLVIPPAWIDVWICPDPCGHLQATGRDTRGRKQNRYHARWREARDETKFAKVIAFGKALPQIRSRVEHDLELPGLSRNKVLATVVRLLEVSLIRVGNEAYARENESFGLTTMRDRHVDVNGSAMSFHFRGKSGKQYSVGVRDKRLARIVKRCQDLPGQELFQYIGDDGRRHSIGSEEVNDYLREISGQNFTAKDFRTWAGTVLAACALQEFQEFDSKVQAKKNVVQAIESVAGRLGNTAAVCRKCYIHPEVLNGYMDGTLFETLKTRAQNQFSSLKSLPPEEAAVLALLQRRLKSEKGRLEKELRASIKQQKKARKLRGREQPMRTAA